MGSRILVIDDDDGVRGFIAKALQLHGFEAAVADEGGAGLRQFAAGGCDAVICDLVMPGREGMETIRDLRALAPELPILAISGSGPYEFDYLPMALKMGADAVLAKPFSLQELLTAVGGILTSDGRRAA